MVRIAYFWVLLRTIFGDGREAWLLAKMPTGSLSLFAFLRQTLRPHRGWLGLGMAVRILWAFETSMTPYVLKRIIDTITTFEGSAAEVVPCVMPFFYAYAALWGSRALYFRVGDLVDLMLYPNIRRDVAVRMFSALTGHAHRYFQHHLAGSLQQRISDTLEGTSAVVESLKNGMAQVLMVSIALFTMARIHPVFAMILGAWLLSFVAIAWRFSGGIRERSDAFAKARSHYIGTMGDSLKHMLSVRLFARHSYEGLRNGRAIDDTVMAQRDMRLTILKMRIFWDTTIVGMMVGMLFTLIYMYSLGRVTLGDFSLVVTLSTSLFHSVWWFINQVTEFSEKLSKCRQGLAILNAPYEVIDRPEAKPLKVDGGAIVFKGVTFAYEEGKEVFAKLDLRIASGERVGLVGFSGSGKTTLVNLLLRLFDPQDGCIAIDGQAVQGVTQDSLREHIAMIPQHATLFHRTLMENIRYGRLGAGDEEVIEAAKQACCHDFIDALPSKYGTLAGEQGLNLSGGQRQRIAIARAFLKDAPILVLDEATSALDAVTERAIQRSLDVLMKGRTTIVIAHRLSTLAKMDRILVFDKGRIIERGDHATLLSKEGLYARMWAMQGDGFLPTGGE